MCVLARNYDSEHSKSRERRNRKQKKKIMNDNTEFTQLEWIVDNIKLIDFEKHAVDSTCYGVFGSLCFAGKADY